MSNDLAKELILWRETVGINQEHAARLFGVSSGGYRHWEARRRKPPATVGRILSVYRMLAIMAPKILGGIINDAKEPRE